MRSTSDNHGRPRATQRKKRERRDDAVAGRTRQSRERAAAQQGLAEVVSFRKAWRGVLFHLSSGPRWRHWRRCGHPPVPASSRTWSRMHARNPRGTTLLSFSCSEIRHECCLGSPIRRQRPSLDSSRLEADKLVRTRPVDSATIRAIPEAGASEWGQSCGSWERKGPSNRRPD